MAFETAFTEEEMVVSESVGYPKAYAKLCRDRRVSPYSHGPPFTYTPYSLEQDETLRARDLDQMFPIIDPKAKPTAKPKIYVSLLWKQLNHLGNAGFDPTVIRVDPYGNVLYYHADSASPLAWDIDHWFPCSRGGLTVASNLRILQRQVCKKKHSKLEFLIPWWEFQLGISVNQFLSIFASKNSDFRHRTFSFLFSEGENEELNASQKIESHSFPQHFIESKERIGLAPAAIVVSRREHYDTSSTLKSLDYNRQLRSQSPAIAARKVKPNVLKENENPDFVTNPYQAIVMARDSLKQREESVKLQTEVQKLDDEVNELKQKNEEEKLTIQELELVLIKRRRRAEKCRRLAEAQHSYRTMLEKMIRDAMHQSVIYKEQVRLNQAASNALMARLEAQKAICDASEKELHRKYKQRDEIELQIRPDWEQARKRSRMDDTFFEERDSRTVLCLPGIKPKTPIHKELRVFLEEEQRASEAGLSLDEEGKLKEIEEEVKVPAKNITKEKPEEHNGLIVALEDEIPLEDKLHKLEIGEGKKFNIQFPVPREPEIEEDEESRKQRGKGNVEKWLQMLLESTQEELDPQNVNESEKSKTDDIIRKLNQKYPQKEVKISKPPESEEKDGVKGIEEIVEIEAREVQKEEINVGGTGIVEGIGSSRFEGGRERRDHNGKERKLVRSESARGFRRIPSSPSLMLGMKKGVDCIGKKPMVSGDDDSDGDHAARNSFIKSSIRTIKKAVKI
ncbi:uncharacterized protein LOC132187525 isoform X2 [Corylus avellana]|uniref:uncharacterized protein LOC132187525 isoform X2 n=1 Tax=Corylus avellana TaxID=13451 RepID=UPI001E2326B2|nr:uncharacterized protein LOC132187525 isoform X2 [Corylus avellana]